MNKGSSATTRVTVIQPETGWLPLNLKEIWQFRDLLQLLVWRDISTRYRQSLLGIGWAIFRPLISALIFTVVFSWLIKIETEVPYPIFAFSAMIPWLYFSTSLTSVTASVTAHQPIITKVYFPRIILPLSAVGPGLVEILIQLVILVLLMVWFGITPSAQLIALPVFVLLAVITAFSFGLWLTAFNVKYRDVGMAVPFLVQIWMYLCPIVYPVSVVPEPYRFWYGLNPMVGVIEGFRWSVLGTDAPDVWSVIGSLMVVLILLVGGLYYFRRVEAQFADII